MLYDDRTESDKLKFPIRSKYSTGMKCFFPSFLGTAASAVSVYINSKSPGKSTILSLGRSVELIFNHRDPSKLSHKLRWLKKEINF